MHPKSANRVFFAVLSGGLLLLAFGAATESVSLSCGGLLLAFPPFCGYYLGKRDGTCCPRCKKEI